MSAMRKKAYADRCYGIGQRCSLPDMLRRGSGISMLFRVGRIGKMDMTITEMLSVDMLTKELYDCEYKNDFMDDEDDD
jgi:hypothetical protein